MWKLLRNVLLAALYVMLGTTPEAEAGRLFSGFFGSGERGSGDLITETRDLKSFDRIENSTSMDLFITIGDEQKVTVTIDDNLMELIDTRVRGRSLKISADDSFNSRGKSRIDITVTSLTQLRVKGSGDIEIEGLDGETFEIRLQGSGDVEVEGKVNELEISVQGSGDIDARHLIADDVEVRIQGSGDVSVHAVESFDGMIQGSGDISCYGDPDYTDESVHGSGDIRYRR